MSPRLGRSLLLVSTLVISLLPGSPAGASAAQDDRTCVSGSAFLASSQRPHLVDQTGDVSDPQSDLPGAAAHDLAALWISAHLSEPKDFFLNLEVASLSALPPNTAYYFQFGSGRPWLSAKYNSDGSWEFQWGNRPFDLAIVGALYLPRGTASGTVDAATGVISIKLPREILSLQDMRSPEPFGPITSTSNLSADAPATVETPLWPDTPGMILASDSFADGQACDVSLLPPPEGTTP